MVEQPLGTPRPLWRVIAFSVLTGLAYYGWYKWVIQDELRRYDGESWSGARCLIPFVLGIAVPQLLRIFDPDVPGWFGWFSLVGVVWIYIAQFRLYRTVNALYEAMGAQPPLIIWWMFIPGLNLMVGLRQIHFLSRYWAVQRGENVPDPIADNLPLFFSEA